MSKGKVLGGYPHVKRQPVRQGQTTTPGTTCPTLFDKCVGSLTVFSTNLRAVRLPCGPCFVGILLSLKLTSYGCLKRFDVITNGQQLLYITRELFIVTLKMMFLVF